MKNIVKLNKELTYLSKNKQRLYAIVDAGIYGEIIDIFDIDAPKHRILFKDEYIEEYENVAPYIIDLNNDENVKEQILSKGYGETWLTFLLSSNDIDTLANTLKERINVYSQKHDKEIIFRFYDPRNFERYLKMHTKEQLTELYGDVSGSFAFGDLEDKTKLNVYSVEGKKVLDLVVKESA